MGARYRYSIITVSITGLPSFPSGPIGQWFLSARGREVKALRVGEGRNGRRSAAAAAERAVEAADRANLTSRRTRRRRMNEGRNAIYRDSTAPPPPTPPRGKIVARSFAR